MSMIKDAICKIEDMSKPVEMPIEGRMYVSKSIVAVKEPMPSPISIHTLTGIVDYIQENPDGLNIGELIIHVRSHDEVIVMGPIFGVFEQRKIHINCSTILDQFCFGEYIDTEKFVIKMQSLFVQDDTTAKILSIAGNIVDEDIKTLSDDGVSQVGTRRVGIQRREQVPIPNPVTLCPFRTFLEAEQPISNFVFRMQSGGGGLPKCGLWEADGGKWKLDAIQNTAKWLAEEIKEPIRILS